MRSFCLFVLNRVILAAILDHTNGLVQAFVRGLDASGFVHGAGGVGGLLSLLTSTNGNHFYAFDGNGNVVGLISATNGTETARYDYGPFAEPIRVTGPMGTANPVRFSSQFADYVTGRPKYLHREYDPQTGRWLSRDMIVEKGSRLVHLTTWSPRACSSPSCGRPRKWGQISPAVPGGPAAGDGKDLYSFVSQDPVSKIDPNGEAVWWDCVACGAALVGKFGGSLAGCLYGCAENSSDRYPYGQCLSDCLSIVYSPCELWRSFKGNPAEWLGAAACVSCGVRVIKDLMTGPPPGCDTCKPPVKPEPPKWKPRICIYIYGSGPDGRFTVVTETYPGEYDGGCPPRRYGDLDTLVFGPFPSDWPPVPPSPPIPPPVPPGHPPPARR